ncbi:HEAT repeat domain-containing protein [Clostridium sediminicola]|uniref:HEAT repeat domain-containing protein n=1 Tax=Clostridium sediminicola TaxID=3114879 RepID=UPI0031F26D27
MKKGLIEFNWKYIDSYSEEDISYFLFLEGKSIDTISRIRNLDKSIIQKHIINGKIKFRYFIKNNSIDEFFRTINSASKDEKSLIVQNLNIVIQKKLIKYINENYADFSPNEKQKAVWILGELKDPDSLKVLIKASVNKIVNVRRMAISAMNKLNDSKCEEHLIRALYDENPQVVLYSIKGLQNLHSNKAIEHVIKLKNIWKKDYLLREGEKLLNIMGFKEE